jgi:toxin YoeB
MNKDVVFTATALRDYMEWQATNNRIAGRINALIKDIQRNGPMSGIGKPELLRRRNGYSRRIDEYNRLVYRIDENQNLRIVSCKGHYEE